MFIDQLQLPVNCNGYHPKYCSVYLGQIWHELGITKRLVVSHVGKESTNIDKKALEKIKRAMTSSKYFNFLNIYKYIRLITASNGNLE